jgi:hypothetical protein
MCIGGSIAAQTRESAYPHLSVPMRCRLISPSFGDVDNRTADAVDVEHYYWMPWRVDGDNFFGFWVHESIKGPLAVMRALIDGYHPNQSGPYPP